MEKEGAAEMEMYGVERNEKMEKEGAEGMALYGMDMGWQDGE